MGDNYGSFGEGRGVTGRENWENRQERSRMETLESMDEKSTIRSYICAGLVIMAIGGGCCYVLWGHVSSQLQGMSRHSSLPFLPAEKSHGAAMPPTSSLSAQRRLLIKHLLQDPAVIEAQALTWDQIDDWARAHPAEPVHNGMILILVKEATHYKSLVVKKVEQKLSEIQSCDAAHVCKENQIAANVRAQACPAHAPCPEETLSEIARLAHWSATIAVDGAFRGLRQEVEKQKRPPRTADISRGVVANTLATPQMNGRPPSAYGQAATVGMGYEPAGYVPSNVGTAFAGTAAGHRR